MTAVVALVALPLLWRLTDLPEYRGGDGIPFRVELADGLVRGLWRACWAIGALGLLACVR